MGNEENNTVQQFRQLWCETCNAVQFRIRKAGIRNRPVTQSLITEIVQTEVREKRWESTQLRHPARQFLDELLKREPAVGASLRHKIAGFEVNAGLCVQLFCAEAVAALALLVSLFFWVYLMPALRVILILMLIGVLIHMGLELSRSGRAEQQVRLCMEHFGQECERLLTARQIAARKP